MMMIFMLCTEIVAQVTQLIQKFNLNFDTLELVLKRRYGMSVVIGF